MTDKLSFSDRLKHGWNAFRNKDPGTQPASSLEVPATRFDYSIGPISYTRPDKKRLSLGTDRTIATAIYNRLATDCTRVRFEHCRVDENDRYLDRIDSGLNYALRYEPNIDQSSDAFIQDVVLSMLDEGVVAVVPVDTTINPSISGSYDIKTMRTGKILSWYPQHVQVELYNEATGQKEPLIVPKKTTAIIENPFYSVMNEQNSVLKRLLHKLALMDDVDEIAASGKLDLIIQLPYVIKSKARKEQAEERLQQIKDQLRDSEYGIAYTDGTERITQLNRAVENNLMAQIEYLTSMLYSQLGLTAEIMNGTANESAMLNYHNRTINVILDAIAIEFERKFLTKTARSQKQAIKYFRDPFEFTTSQEIADIADKFTRNEILSSNDMRGVIGFKPSDDPKADELQNSNLYSTGSAGVEEPYSSEEDAFIEDVRNNARIQNEGVNYDV